MVDRNAAAVRAGYSALAAAAAVVVHAGTRGRTAYRLRQVHVPVLPADRPPVRLLHLSDLHVWPGDSRGRRRFIAWVRELARLVPDLVVVTGDLATSEAAYDPVLDALEPLLDFPGVFVPGNNDYHAAAWANPLPKLLDRRNPHRAPRGRPLPWARLAAALRAAGWQDLTHRRVTLAAGGVRVDARGVDDATVRRDDYDAVAGPASADSDVAIGLLHTPAPRLLDRFAADGVAVLLAGHTHGGQLRLPGVGALVTNCALDRAHARGLTRWRSAWLHVTAGLGVSPYFPFRLCCQPEATLLTLLPAG